MLPLRLLVPVGPTGLGERRPRAPAPAPRRARVKVARRCVDPGRVADQRSIDRALFREAPDGATVFFPWGLTHRGYCLTGDADKKKAARAASLLIGSVIAIGTWTAYRLEPLLESESEGVQAVLRALLAPGVALVVAIGSYAVWAQRFVEGLQESDLRISREERLREAAQLVPAWKLDVIGVVVCGLSGLLIWLQPQAWWLGMLGLALGLGALWWNRLLRRAAADR